jgi:hypothetical protein
LDWFQLPDTVAHRSSRAKRRAEQAESRASGVTPILPGVAHRPAPLSAVFAVCALLVGAAVALTRQGLAIAADGSYYLVRILETGSIYGPDYRVFANAVRQAPILVATASGVTDTHVLTLVQGVGQLLLPAVAWSIAVALSRSNRIAFAAVAMTAGLCMGTTWFFNVSESVLAVPLTIVVAVLLWQPRAWHWSDAALAAAASTVLVASYESALITGALLAAWAAWRARRASVCAETYGCMVVAALSLLSVLVAIAGTRTGASPAGSQSLLYFVVSLEPWPFYVALAGTATVIAALGPWLHGNARRLGLGLGVAALVLAVWRLEPSMVTSFQARGGAAVAGFALMVFLLWRWIRTRHSPGEADTQMSTHLLVAVPIVFVASMLAVNVQPVRSWSRSLDAFRSEVEKTDNMIEVPAALPPNRREVVWGWTSSSLSLLLRSDQNAGILVDRDPSYVPFPPSDAREQLGDEYTWGE